MQQEPASAASDLKLDFPAQVRRLRRERGWTLEDLASVSGVSRSMLSQVERGQANPTLGVAVRIARAFSVSLDDLTAAPPPREAIEVIRAGDPAYYFRDDPNCRIRTLSPLRLEKDAEFYEVRLAEGQALRSAAHVPRTRELLAVQQGRVRVRSGGHQQDLAAGDSAYYPADVEHAIENAGDGPCVAFLVDLYPS